MLENLTAPFLTSVLVVLSFSDALSAERPDGGVSEPWFARKGGLLAILGALLMFLFPRPHTTWIDLALLAGWAVLAVGVVLDGRIAKIASAVGGAILAAMGLLILFRDGVSPGDALPPSVVVLTLALFTGAVLLGRRRRSRTQAQPRA